MDSGSSISFDGLLASPVSNTSAAASCLHASHLKGESVDLFAQVGSLGASQGPHVAHNSRAPKLWLRIVPK